MTETPHRRFRPSPSTLDAAGNAWDVWDVTDLRTPATVAEDARAFDGDGPRR